jgi:carboxylesterase
VSDIPHPSESADIELLGGKIGVLLIHDFLASPENISAWADGLALEGFSVSAPAFNSTSWPDWYRSAESAFLKLRERSERIFIAGHGAGAAIALRLAQIRGSELEGAILLNALIYEESKARTLVARLAPIISTIATPAIDCAKPVNNLSISPRTPLSALRSLHKLIALVEEDLYLVDLPLMVAYSLDDHRIHPANSETIIDNVYSADIREVIFEHSFHEVSADFDSGALIDESIAFIKDVLTGEVARGESLAAIDERELIDAEFEAIVSGISLDSDTSHDGADNLENLEVLFSDLGLNDHFIPPRPSWQRFSREIRPSTIAISVGLLYIALYLILGIDPIGLGPWPGIFTFLGGLATLIWRSAKSDDGFGESDDGAVI